MAAQGVDYLKPQPSSPRPYRKECNACLRPLWPLTAATNGEQPSEPAKPAANVVALQPLYYYSRQGASYTWYALGGLFHRSEDPAAGASALGLPLYYSENRSESSYRVLFPLFSHERWRRDDGWERRTSLLGLLYRSHTRPGYSETDVLYPLIRLARGSEAGLSVYSVRLLPLFSYTRRWEPAGASGAIRYERRWHICWPLLYYYCDNYGAGYKRIDVLWPLVRYTRGCPVSPRVREQTFLILPLTGWAKYWEYDDEGQLVDHSVEFHLADPVFSYKRNRRDGMSLRLLGPAVSYERNANNDRDLRILVGAVRLARIQDKRIFRLWPLVASEWDSRSGARKVWLLAGSFYYRRAPDGGVVKRIFWFIPLSRARGQGRASPSAPEAG